MSRTRWIVVVVLAVAGGWLIWDRVAQDRAVPPTKAVPVIEAQVPEGNSQVRAGAASTTAKPSGPAASQNFAAGYRDADDLLAFLNRLAPAAEAGDANAMYWMFRASRRCTRDFLLYLGGPERSRSLERALAANAQARMDEKSTREIYARCATFKAATDNPYRDYRALLKHAADAGNPVAKANLATELTISQQMVRNSPNIDDQIRALARDALRSKQPAVLMALAVVAASLGNSAAAGESGAGRPSSDETSVWMIAACQRGFDCSVDNEEFRYACALEDACQPFDTVVDMLRRQRPEKFSELELRASELNAKLDADRFDEIDL